MKWRFYIFVVCLGGLLIGLSTQMVRLANSNEEVRESSYIPEEQSTKPTESSYIPGESPGATNENALGGDRLYQQAQSLTVKVLSGQTSGSGIAIHKQGEEYTVVTNRTYTNIL